MKTRFSNLDLRAILPELRSRLNGLRLANVYDQNDRTYLFKFSGQEGHKEHLIIESGLRIHLTQYSRDTGQMPNAFSMKLRKHLRTLRINDIEQLGVDRAIDMCFGYGDKTFHLIIEFYAAGNVILTDGGYVILALLRTHKASGGEDGNNTHATYAVREVYPFSTARVSDDVDYVALATSGEALLSAPVQEGGTDKKRKKKGQSNTLKRWLTMETELGAALVEDALVRSGIDASMDAVDFIRQNQGGVQGAIETLKPSISWALERLRQVDLQISKGYIYCIPAPVHASDGPQEVYEDYEPIDLQQNTGMICKDFDTFNAAVDEFYSKLEAQRSDLKAMQQELNVQKRLERQKEKLQENLDEFQKHQDDNRVKATMLEENIDIAEKAQLVINSFIANGMSWSEIDRMLQEAKAKGDPTASYIHALKLEMNTITLRFQLGNNNSEDSMSDNDEEENEISDEDEAQANSTVGQSIPEAQDAYISSADRKKMAKRTQRQNQSAKRGNKRSNKLSAQEQLRQQGIVLVDLDLGQTVYANIRRYHDMKKVARKKEEKAQDATEQAMKNAEKKAMQALKEVKTSNAVQKMRKPFWFEKFLWFISSDNYTVVAGRDAQQNELLVKRYLTKTDVYVHADIHGATSVVIKNRVTAGDATPEELRIPPRTLYEAGTMAMCHSSAWDSKIVTSAYWVYSHQVSKTAPSGEYVSTGSFVIRGRKNYLPPSQLIMGYTLLFRVDDTCIARHLGERNAKGVETESEISSAPTNPDQDITHEAVESMDSVHGDGHGTDDEELGDPAVLENGIADDEDNNEDSDSDIELPDTDLRMQPILATSTQRQDADTDILGETSAQATKSVFDKYNLSEQADHNEEDDHDELPEALAQHMKLAKDTDSGDAEVNTKKGGYITAKQRRLIKKYGPQALENEAELMAKMDEEEEADTVHVTRGMEVGQKKATLPPPPLKRGQKGKRKKMMEKYKDQDEEDRRLRMQLLNPDGKQGGSGVDDGEDDWSLSKSKGGKGKKKNKKDKGNKAKQMQETQAKAQEKPEELRRNLPLPVPSPAELRQQQQEKKKQEQEQKKKEHELAMRTSGESEKLCAANEEEDVKKVLKEEGIEFLSGEVLQSLDQIDALTGMPFNDDIMQYALPMVAPYATVVNNKFRLKVTPGSQKKGKAAQSIVQSFLRQKDCTAQEKDLIKAIRDQDLIVGLPGKIRVAGVGVTGGGAKGGKGKGGGKKR
eukprot:Clim_evm17s235 gene=Clim_evmTU17s235